MNQASQNKQHANDLLRKMIGTECDFREGQWEAIEAVTIRKQRALVIQRTGWGKSMVYFLSTKILREANSGPTLLISPLLSLMRNQIEMASRIGLRAYTINSANQDEWKLIEEALLNDECDLILISPERLNNDHFINNILPTISGRIGLFVVDEAHCISDWGHDFRPDYMRILRILKLLPEGIPVLCTTATANNRVVEDIKNQIGTNMSIYRGPLGRDSLRLQNISLKNQEMRLAWLVENLPRFRGSGIIYCLTVRDTEKVAEWLRKNGFSAEAYHSGFDETVNRSQLELEFIRNETKILVATVALGMGFDKPDIEYVIHYQRPGSVIAYYQQVGRAGRSLEKSYGILLNGEEDDAIQEYFIESAFPSIQIFEKILLELEKHETVTLTELLNELNISKSMAEKALKILEVEGAVGQIFEKQIRFFRTPNPWKPDFQRIDRITELRRSEMTQMQDYVNHTGCLMKFLLDALDDPNSTSCLRCSNCQHKGFSSSVSPKNLLAAEDFLRHEEISIKPKTRLPQNISLGEGVRITSEMKNKPGRVLTHYGNSKWGVMVKSGKYEQGEFSNELVISSAELILHSWNPDPFPAWITSIPSNRHPTLVQGFAKRLSEILHLPYSPVLIRIGDAPQQKTMQNNAMQARNVIGTLAIENSLLSGPCLLIDDIIDSGWTMTIAGALLHVHGCEIVYPFALAKATGRI